MKMELSADQKEIVRDLFVWLKQVKTPYISIGGYAGTGKTTLIANFRKILQKLNPKIKVAFGAYTGKASQVLKNYLQLHEAVISGDQVSTIHALIYAPMTNKEGKITGWKRKVKLDFDLVIIDEASMVDEGVWHDLLSFELPIIAVGDHGQLPPIGSDFNLMNKPMMTLNEIHRQARDNPIIKVSMLARTNGEIPVRDFGRGVVKLNKMSSDAGQAVEEMLTGYQENMLILSGYNYTRVKLNQAIRRYRELEGSKPRVGDRVICLKNNWDKGIYNGMLGKIQRLIPVQLEGKVHWYDAEIQIDDGGIYSGKISAHQFNQDKTLMEHKGIAGKALGDLFDFGYALTVHKAQGSQAESVLLFEERNKYMDDTQWRRWLYTAVTRAQERLTIVGT